MLAPSATTVQRSATAVAQTEQTTDGRSHYDRKKDILLKLKRWWSLIFVVVLFIVRAIPLITDPAGVMEDELATLALKTFGLKLLGYLTRKVVKKK